MSENQKILITNNKGQWINSDLLTSSENLNAKQDIFVKQILSFAEIALGKAG